MCRRELSTAQGPLRAWAVYGRFGRHPFLGAAVAGYYTRRVAIQQIRAARETSEEQRKADRALVFLQRSQEAAWDCYELVHPIRLNLASVLDNVQSSGDALLGLPHQLDALRAGLRRVLPRLSDRSCHDAVQRLTGELFVDRPKSSGLRLHDVVQPIRIRRQEPRL